MLAALGCSNDDLRVQPQWPYGSPSATLVHVAYFIRSYGSRRRTRCHDKRASPNPLECAQTLNSYRTGKKEPVQIKRTFQVN
jgi:hypothetical protein